MAVNKIDRPGQESEASEFYALGGDELFFISAAHGRGVDELLDQVVARLPERASAAAASPDLRLALIGRPNVGKSSILNRLSGFDRAIVDDTPGTTRDPVDVRLTSHGRDVLLIDTAGIRRPPKVEGELEHHSVGRAIETIRRANVVLLVIDASEGITDQDARLARLVDTSDRAMVIVCNKWDVAAKQGRKLATFVRDAHERYPFLEYASMVIHVGGDRRRRRWDHPGGDRGGRFVARGVSDLACSIARWPRRRPRWIRRRSIGGGLNLMYVTQVGNAPPRLAIFHQRRARHPGALRALHRNAFSQIAGAGRHAAATRLSSAPAARGCKALRRARRAASRATVPPRERSPRARRCLWNVERGGISYAARRPVYFNVQ